MIRTGITRSQKLVRSHYGHHEVQDEGGRRRRVVVGAVGVGGASASASRRPGSRTGRPASTASGSAASTATGTNAARRPGGMGQVSEFGVIAADCRPPLLTSTSRVRGPQRTRGLRRPACSARPARANPRASPGVVDEPARRCGSRPARPGNHGAVSTQEGTSPPARGASPSSPLQVGQADHEVDRSGRPVTHARSGGSCRPGR